MCRWFAYISASEPCLLADVLITPAHALTKQVSGHYLPGLLPRGREEDHADPADMARLVDQLLNIDGVGIAWYSPVASAYSSRQNGPRPAMYKTQNPPMNDFNFRQLCENTESYCLFAHIRATSGGAVTPINNHPFMFGRHIFMHNGNIRDFHRVRREMLELIPYTVLENIKGTTDTEHCAALYITFLTGGLDSTRATWQAAYTLEEMKAALTKTVVTICTIQRRILGADAHANGMNFCATDGMKLVSCRFRNHATDDPSSLYWSEFAGRELNRKYPGDPNGRKIHNPNQCLPDDAKVGTHTIIASEPTTYDRDEWHLIPKNHMVLVDEDGWQTVEPLQCPEELYATAASDAFGES